MVRGDAPPSAPSGPRVVVPTVVVGLGKAGGELVASIRAEAQEGGANGNANARFIIAAAGDQGLGDAFRSALGELLSVRQALLVSRDGPSNPLDVFVVAEIADDDVTPVALTHALGQLDAGFARFASLLQVGERGQRVFASPILMLPDMAATAPAERTLRDETVTLLTSLHTRFGPGVAPPALPYARCWLVESQTSSYLLDATTRRFMVRSFLRFLLFGSLRTDEEYRRLFDPRDEDPDPFGSFVVACAELPGGGVVRELTAVEGARRAMEAFERPSGVDIHADLAAYRTDKWIDQWLDGFPDATVEAGVTAAINRRVPTPEDLEKAGILARPIRIHARVGPAWVDTTRRSLTVDDGDEVVGEAVRSVVHAMAREGARRVDERVAALDTALAAWLEGDNAAHHLDALAFLGDVEAAVDRRRAAEGVEAAAAPDPGPDLGLLDSAVAELRTEVDKKADPLLLLPLGGLVLALVIALGAGLLPMLAGIFERPGQARPGWLVILRDEPYYVVTATLIVLAGVGGFLLYRLWAQTRAINRQLGGDSAGTESVMGVVKRLSGPRPQSVRAFYESRYRLTKAHWRARALSDLLRGVRARRARLVRAQEAAHAQRRALDARHEQLTARLRTEATETPLGVAALPVDTVRELVELAAAGTLGDQPVQRTKRVLRPYQAGALAVPFADVEPLLEAVRRGAGTVSLGDVLQTSAHRATARERILRLVADVAGLQRLGGGMAAGMRLHLPLQVVGLEDDPRGVANVDRPRVFAAADVLAVLRGMPEQEPRHELLEAAKAFHDPDRVYLLQVAWGIHASSIAWLRDAWPAKPSDEAVIPIDRARKTEDGR